MVDPLCQCQAKSKQSGERCKRPAAPGKRVCHMHGAKAGAPKGNLNGMVHGIYVPRIMDAEEEQIHDIFIEAIRRDFELNYSSDEISVRMAALAFVQYVRAMKAADAKGADVFDGIVLRHLKTLKATKIVREGETPEIKTTPADWASALLEEVKAARKAGRKGKKRAKADHGKASDADRTPKEPQI